MTLVADSAGVLQGKFTIPEGVLAGTKLVELTGSGGSMGSVNFVGQGTLQTDTLQDVIAHTTHNRYYDPLAQTFMLSTLQQAVGVDIFITKVGTTPFVVQLRETDVGMPTRDVIAETQLRVEDVTEGQLNRFTFDAPVTLQPDVEYALVVMCNDAAGEVGVSELGKWDASGQAWVTSQPYNVGVLLSSSNASTWTPHQDRDLTFRLLTAQYTQPSHEVNLGKVTVSDTTDLLVLAAFDQPAVQANGGLEVTLPDGSKVQVSNGQVLRFNNPITGDVQVKAKLNANQATSARLLPGTQIVAGEIAASADYVSRAFQADAAGADIRIIFDAMLPSGAGVDVFVAGTEDSDWTPVSQHGAAVQVGAGVHEYQFLATDVEKARIRVKLVLRGSAAARPYVANLRVSVT